MCDTICMECGETSDCGAPGGCVHELMKLPMEELLARIKADREVAQ